MKTVAKPLYSLASLQQEFQLSGDAAAVLASRSTGVDSLLTQVFRSILAPEFGRGLALVATGGYGRAELFPCSDIDLLLLVDKEPQTEQARQAISVFLRTLWDNGLRLSQSVHTIPECCRLDDANVELSVSLLDARFLIGDSSLFEQFAERWKRYLRSSRETIVRHLCEMTRKRHSTWHNTIYHLEPNIKEGPGGFRDLHVVRWIRQMRDGPDDLTEGIGSAQAFLSSLRCRLHFRAGRDNNVLSFDVQEEFAPDPAEWMREFYRHARDINRAALRQVELGEQTTEGGLIRSFRDWRSRLSNSEFTVARDRLFLRSPQQLARDPSLSLRMFEFIARHGIRLSAEAERRIRDSTLYFEEYFASKPPVWPALRTILLQPYASLALRAMHDTGFLSIVLPVWEDIECLVVRDFYHRYTVDEHTLVAIEYLEELRATRDLARRRFCELLKETEDVAPLYMALLFHDIGKTGGLEGHAAVSVQQARGVLERLRIPEADTRTILFLIEHHLALSAVMNGRDLGDPATALDLASKVETLENLKQLTLMTYADISAVNPEAMTPWRLEQLWRTYLVAHRELTRELDTERIHTDTPADNRARWLEGFPTRYLRTHTQEEIDSHVELAQTAADAGVAVDLSGPAGAWRLTVVAPDKPGLFAALVGTLAAFGLNIVKAEAFSNRSGTALDTFVFEDPMRTLELNPEERDRLTTTVSRAVLGREDVRRLLRGRARSTATPGRPLPTPSVSFDNSASETATLIELVAPDRPGLLYDLANTLSEAGCSIEVVLIDTEAHKAIDVFYVTAAAHKLSDALQQQLRAGMLAVCVP